MQVTVTSAYMKAAAPFASSSGSERVLPGQVAAAFYFIGAPGQEGDLASTVKALAEAEAALDEADRNCMQMASDHEETVKGRAAELAAIADAKNILEETTGGAKGQTYSLLQM